MLLIESARTQSFNRWEGWTILVDLLRRTGARECVGIIEFVGEGGGLWLVKE